MISTAIQFIDGFTKPSKAVIDNMKKMGNQAINTGKQIQRAGKTIAGAGSTLTKAITLPIAGAAVAAVKMSNDFTNAMAKVATIADTTAVPLDVLSKQVIKLSNVVGVGVTEIAEAQYQAISAGVQTARSVEFVETAIKAAKGGFTDATTAVDGLTTVLNAYGLEASRATNISDQMLVAQNFGKTSFGDMASSMGKVIPIASSLNVSTEELFSSIAVLTKNGIGTSEAVTGLKAAYSNILKPTADAAKVSKGLGLNFTAAHLSSVGWAKFLEEIKVKTKGNAEVMAKLFGSTEALNSVMVLAGKGSKDFSEALGLMSNATGATEAAYQKMLTPAEKMNISINKLKNSLIQFGSALTPIFNKAADLIGKIGDKLNNLSESQVQSIVKFAGIAAAIGPILVTFGKAVTWIGKMKTGFGIMIKTIGNFGGIAGIITSPAGIVIGVLAAIAVAAFVIIKNWEKVKTFLANVGNWFKDTMAKAGYPVERFKEQFITIGNTIRENIRRVGRFLSSAFQGIKNFFANLGSTIRNIITMSGVNFNKFTGYFENVKVRVGNIINNLKTIFAVVFPIIKNIVILVAKDIMAKFKQIVEAIKVAMAIIVPVIKVAFSVVGSVIAMAVELIANGISNLMTVFDGITTFIAGVFTGNWSKAWEGVKTIFKGIFESLVALVKAPMNAVIAIINGAISGINKLGLTIPDWVPMIGGKGFAINVPTIPMLYKGTSNWAGGTAVIHDKGGEIVDLPRGSRVYPHDKSLQMARKEGERNAGTILNIHIQKLAERIEVRSDDDIDRIVEKLAMKLKHIALNTV